jgi:hypothetical protein
VASLSQIPPLALSSYSDSSSRLPPLHLSLFQGACRDVLVKNSQRTRRVRALATACYICRPSVPTGTDTNSGVPREPSSDLTASSAVNLPMSNASFRLVVICTGVGSTRRTYSGARVPRRFTFTTNLIFFMSSPLRKQSGGLLL